MNTTVIAGVRRATATRTLRAQGQDPRTVVRMSWMVSSPTADGSVMLLRLPEGAKVHATFLDTEEDRDITDWAADLMLIGLAARTARTGWGDSLEVERVQVANVTLLGADDFEAIFAHPNSGVTATYGWSEGSELLAEGVSEQITSAVAADVAAVPESAPEL